MLPRVDRSRRTPEEQLYQHQVHHRSIYQRHEDDEADQHAVEFTGLIGTRGYSSATPNISANTSILKSSWLKNILIFLLGICTILTLQHLSAPSLLPQPIPAAEPNNASLTTEILAECPRCDVEKVAQPTVVSSAPQCHSIHDQPANLPAITATYSSSSYSPLPLNLRILSCLHTSPSKGAWRVRSTSNDPYIQAMLKVDRWGMYGNAKPKPAGSSGSPAEDVFAYEYIDEECLPQKFNAESFLRALSGKTLSFLGDSLMRQQFGMLTVMLNEFILGTSLFYPPHARYYDPIREVYLKYNVTLKNQWITGSNGIASGNVVYETLWRSDLLVVNIGAFFQSGEEEERKLKGVVEEMVRKVVKGEGDSGRRKYEGQILWREYSPTHFDTVDGEYNPTSTTSSTCRSFDPTSSSASLTLNNYRRISANAIMQQHAIPILPIFLPSLTIPNQAELHPTGGDCRHWYFPSAVIEMWNVMLYNLVIP